MFPYSDNLKHQKRFYSVHIVILVLILVNIPLLIDRSILEWAALYCSFIPVLFSVDTWGSLYRLISALFIHGDIFHLLGNCLFLLVFGRSLEKLFGPLTFLCAFPFLGITGFILNWAIEPNSTAPIIGASGAIAMLMGGYLALFPKARIKMLLTFGWFYKRITAPAWAFLFYWGGLQFLSYAMGAQTEDHVAYLVHIGGFIAGVMAGIIWKVSYPFAEEKLLEFKSESFNQEK